MSSDIALIQLLNHILEEYGVDCHPDLFNDIASCESPNEVHVRLPKHISFTSVQIREYLQFPKL